MTSPSPNLEVETLILGLAGKKRSGKNTVANFVGKHLANVDKRGRNIIELAFADSLKDEYCKQQGITREQLELTKDIHRSGLQDYGQSMRIKEGDDYWVRQLIRKIKLLPKEPTYIIITDVRHVNEATFLSGIGANLWRINRVQIGLRDEHITEVALDHYDKWDEVVDNNLSLTTLRRNIQILTDKWFGQFYEQSYEQIKADRGHIHYEYRW